MILQTFTLQFDEYVLQGDTYGKNGNVIVLHGAGNLSRERLITASFDFIGHGQTGEKD